MKRKDEGENWAVSCEVRRRKREENEDKEESSEYDGQNREYGERNMRRVEVME